MISQRVYEIQVLPQKIPIYAKITLQNWTPLKIFLKKLKKNVEIDSEDDENLWRRKQKNDLVIYMSLYNWHPSESDHDF